MHEPVRLESDPLWASACALQGRLHAMAAASAEEKDPYLARHLARLADALATAARRFLQGAAGHGLSIRLGEAAHYLAVAGRLGRLPAETVEEARAELDRLCCLVCEEVAGGRAASA
jgi:hypothetical protein